MPHSQEPLLAVVDRIRSWDMRDFSLLYEALYERLYRFIYTRTLDTPWTEDIISLVFIKILKNIPKLHATTEGELFSWAYRIAYTTLVDTLRREKQHDSLEDMMSEPGFSPKLNVDIDNRSKLEEVLVFLETLSQRDRTILTMRIWDELSYEEIADITGESVANTKQIVSRSLAKIVANIEYMMIFTVMTSFFVS